jgi:hypothetical protein
MAGSDVSIGNAYQVLGGNNALRIRAPSAGNTASVTGSSVSSPGAESPLALTNANRPLLLTNAPRNESGKAILGNSANLLGLNTLPASRNNGTARIFNRESLSANNRNYYNSHKGNVNGRMNNKANPFAAKTLKEAINATRSAEEKAALKTWKLDEEKIRLDEEKAKLDAELEGLKGTLFQGKDYNVYNTVPITFKGDGFGYTAGFGYNFKKGSQYSNFVSGFPYKYYRVYGESCDNATKKVLALRKQIQNTKDAVKRDLATKKLNAKTKLNLQKKIQNNIKEKFAQEKAAARAAVNAAKKSLAAKYQQEKNAALAMMEAKRLTSRARQNVSVSKEAMELAQAREFEMLKRDVAQRLRNQEDPIYGAYSRAGLRSFDELPQNFQNQQFARLRRSPAFSTRVARSARLPLSVLRQYNRARYGLGIGRTARNKTLRATKGATVAAPAFAQGAKNATVKNTRPWYQRMFSRKPAPASGATLGNAYAAMNSA